MTHSRNDRQLCIREVLVQFDRFVQRYERVPISDQHQCGSDGALHVVRTMFNQRAPGRPDVLKYRFPIAPGPYRRGSPAGGTGSSQRLCSTRSRSSSVSSSTAARCQLPDRHLERHAGAVGESADQRLLESERPNEREHVPGE